MTESEIALFLEQLAHAVGEITIGMVLVLGAISYISYWKLPR